MLVVEAGVARYLLCNLLDHAVCLRNDVRLSGVARYGQNGMLVLRLVSRVLY